MGRKIRRGIEGEEKETEVKRLAAFKAAAVEREQTVTHTANPGLKERRERTERA